MHGYPATEPPHWRDPRRRNTSRLPSLYRVGLRVALFVGGLSLVGGAALLGTSRCWPDGAVLPGLRIDGALVPDPVDPQRVRAFAEQRAQLLRSRTISLVLPGTETPALRATLEELGLHVDVERTLAIAQSTG